MRIKQSDNGHLWYVMQMGKDFKEEIIHIAISKEKAMKYMEGRGK